jgi:hypothetical protein
MPNILADTVLHVRGAMYELIAELDGCVLYRLRWSFKNCTARMTGGSYWC